VEEEKTPEEPRVSSIPWKIGDVAAGVGVVIGFTVIIAFGLAIGTILILGSGALLELATEDIAGLYALLASEGVLQQWLILMLVAMVVGEGAMPLSAWLFSAFKYHCGWRALGFRSFNVRNSLILAAVIVIVGLLIGFLWDILLTSLGIEPPSTVPPELTQTGLGFVIVSVLAVVVAPVAEETFFRGFILAGIGKRFGNGWGIVLSALLFSVAHLQIGSLLPIFILGLLLAWLYVKTGSIWPCIFTHLAYNSIAMLFMV
jgi:hypothetical protein